MRRYRPVLLSGALAVTLLTGCSTTDVGAVERYLTEAMELAQSVHDRTGAYPRSGSDLAIQEWDDPSVMSLLSSGDGQELCIQLSLPKEKFSVYSTDPGDVVPGACDFDKVG